MTKTRNIVVATDFSPGSNAAVDRAVLLARADGAALRLLHAFDASAWHSLRGIFDPQRLTSVPPPDVRMRQQVIDLAASLATRTGLVVEACFSVGEADSAISAYVRAHDTSLLVIGSRAEPAMAGIGSTASRLVRSPSCPVLVVRSGQARPYDHVLCAVDMRGGSLRAAAAAVGLFPSAHHLLLCVLNPAQEYALAMDADVTAQSLIQRESMHTLAVRQLEQLAQELSPKTEYPVACQVLEDVPSRAIVERAAALPADCVVVGHHGQEGGTTPMLSSMAQHVLQHSARDVLVVP